MRISMHALSKTTKVEKKDADHANPQSLATLVDEMLAIKGQIETWREKKESEEAQAAYNAGLFYRRGNYDDH